MLKEIITNYKKQAFKVALGWFLTSIMVVAFIAFTIVIIEYAIPTKDINLIVKIGIIYFGINILRSVATFFEDLNDDGFEKEIEADYRQKIYIKLQKLKQSEIDKIKVGEILENIINDTKSFSKYYGSGICGANLAGLGRLIGTLLVLAYINKPIVLVTFLIYIIGFIITHIFNKKSIYYTNIKREANAKILNWSNEQVQGYSTIKSLQIEEERIKQLKNLLSEYEIAANKLEKNIRIYTCIYDFVVSFVGVANILMGTIGVEQGIIDYGAMVILSRYISSPETYARWFIGGFQTRNVARIAYNKFTDILSREEEDINMGEELKNVDMIKFNNVSFSYDGSNKVIENISFSAKSNEKIALVGRTGSGKTSLVNLLCRLYDLKEGSIEINGIDYKKYSIKSLRSNIGYIMQNVVIFNGTVLDNINYCNKDISKEEIINICKKLNLHEKIMSLSNGYETIISNDTDVFSAGEKQLLNFSRVMVENPQIIILDEATASLSYKSEMMMRKAIEDITKDKISFIIAHRLSTVKNCDKILLMKNGKIIEEGNHKELVDKKGEYYQLINS